MFAAIGTRTTTSSRPIARLARRRDSCVVPGASAAYPALVNKRLPDSTSATKFDTNSTRAPKASATAPWPRQTPTTASGGTNEIAMATPGSTAATSRRANATAPANPVATAETRSTSPGEVRLAIWLSWSRSTPPGTANEKTLPIATTARAPRTV